MEDKEIVQALQALHEKTRRYEQLEQELAIKRDVLHRARSRQPMAVYRFDETHKDSYIKERVGAAPEQPGGILKLAVPVYRAKKKEYEKKYAEYKMRYSRCEEDYYKEYAVERKKIEETERKEIDISIQSAEKSFEEGKEKLEKAKRELYEDSTLSANLKRQEIVAQLIQYFENGRVSSIKEAVNLYYEEEHRKKIEEFARKQLELTEEAKEYARKAAESAREAAESASAAASTAQEAINRVDNALERANEAYSKAQEAYDQAQNAYWASSN